MYYQKLIFYFFIGRKKRQNAGIEKLIKKYYCKKRFC